MSVELDAAPWLTINSTIGVSQLVNFSYNYKSLPLNLISSVMLSCEKEGKILPPKTLNTGDSVEVLNGPFANFVATVEKIDVQKRVWVLMEFMGRDTRMKFSQSSLNFHLKVTPSEK